MQAIKLCRLDTPIIFIEARINLSRFVVTGCASNTSATVTFPSLNLIFFFSSRRRHTMSYGDWSSDVCSSDLPELGQGKPTYQRSPVAVDEQEDCIQLF